MSTPTRATLALLAATFSGGGCISAPVSTATDPAGCWYFERDEAAATLNLPWGIRLDGDGLTGFPSLETRGDPRLARTLDPDGERDHPFGYWIPLAGDSIEVGYPAGGGIVLRLARGDTSMGGTARPVGDVVAPGSAPRPVRGVRLTRAQCPAY